MRPVGEGNSAHTERYRPSLQRSESGRPNDATRLIFRVTLRCSKKSLGPQSSLCGGGVNTVQVERMYPPHGALYYGRASRLEGNLGFDATNNNFGLIIHRTTKEGEALTLRCRFR